ncbi:MAG: hypothetical protein JSU82_16615 [Rhodospirillales bacterium]|nr:MAG: hypothetical protein JSU82_16615 [Rhodospirillales bacterium]
MTAICYSAGPAMIALLDEEVRGTARFMLSIGGYLDIESVIRFITTGVHANPHDRASLYRRPDEYGKWVFALSSTGALSRRGDRESLEEMARRRRAEPEADLSDLAAGLDDEGRRVFQLLENRDPDRVAELIAALPRGIVTEITALDLSRRDLSALDMRFILIHGNDDPVIPETQSVMLAAALQRADLFILDSIQHVDPGPSGLGDKLKLLAAVHELLRQRDIIRPPEGPTGESPLRSASDEPVAGPTRPPGMM